MRWLTALLKSEEAQATTEYVLLLAIISGMLLLMVKKLISPAFRKLGERLSDQIEKQFLGANLHVYRVGK